MDKNMSKKKKYKDISFFETWSIVKFIIKLCYTFFLKIFPNWLPEESLVNCKIHFLDKIKNYRL